MPVLNYHVDDIPRDDDDPRYGLMISIMRPGPWGNPFSAARAGGRGNALKLYWEWLRERIRSGDLPLEDLAELHGKYLVCCCHPKPCHGHILEKAADWAHALLDRRRVQSVDGMAEYPGRVM